MFSHFSCVFFIISFRVYPSPTGWKSRWEYFLHVYLSAKMMTRKGSSAVLDDHKGGPILIGGGAQPIIHIGITNSLFPVWWVISDDAVDACLLYLRKRRIRITAIYATSQSTSCSLCCLSFIVLLQAPWLGVLLWHWIGDCESLLFSTLSNRRLETWFCFVCLIYPSCVVGGDSMLCLEADTWCHGVL